MDSVPNLGQALSLSRFAKNAIGIMPKHEIALHFNAMRNSAYALLVLVTLSSLFACGGGRYRGSLPNHVRGNFARDFSCRGRNVEGDLIAAQQYHVFGCGFEAVYVCSGRRGACILQAHGPFVEGQPSQLSAPAQQAMPSAGGEIVVATRPTVNSQQTLDQYLQVSEATLRACGLLCPVVVQVGWAVDGQTTISLPNAPASNAEACLKNAVEPNVRVGGGNAGSATLTLACEVGATS